MVLPNRKRKGNPHPKPPSRRKKKKTSVVAAPVEQILVPKHLEHFCWAIFAGKSAREAAVEIGRKACSSFYIRHHPSVVKRLGEIQTQYQGQKMDREVDGEVLSERFVDENIIDVIANGEDGSGVGRIKAIELAYKRFRYVDPPNAQTIIALQMNQPGKTTNAPKLYEAKRFLQLRQADNAEVPNA